MFKVGNQVRILKVGQHNSASNIPIGITTTIIEIIHDAVVCSHKYGDGSKLVLCPRIGDEFRLVDLTIFENLGD